MRKFLSPKFLPRIISSLNGDSIDKQTFLPKLFNSSLLKFEDILVWAFLTLVRLVGRAGELGGFGGWGVNFARGQFIKNIKPQPVMGIILNWYHIHPGPLLTGTHSNVEGVTWPRVTMTSALKPPEEPVFRYKKFHWNFFASRNIDIRWKKWKTYIQINLNKKQMKNRDSTFN